MRRFLVVALLSVVACRDSTGTVGTSLTGAYQLSTVDGNALPQTVLIDGEPARIAYGDLELSAPNTLSFTLGIGVPGSATFQVLAMSGIYRRVTADSLVFPAIATPEFFIKRTGSSVVVVAQPSGSGIGLGQIFDGPHRLTFVPAPHLVATTARTAGVGALRGVPQGH